MKLQSVKRQLLKVQGRLVTRTRTSLCVSPDRCCSISISFDLTHLSFAGQEFLQLQMCCPELVRKDTLDQIKARAEKLEKWNALLHDRSLQVTASNSWERPAVQSTRMSSVGFRWRQTSEPITKNDTDSSSLDIRRDGDGGHQRCFRCGLPDCGQLTSAAPKGRLPKQFAPFLTKRGFFCTGLLGGPGPPLFGRNVCLFVQLFCCTWEPSKPPVHGTFTAVHRSPQATFKSGHLVPIHDDCQ